MANDGVPELAPVPLGPQELQVLQGHQGQLVHKVPLELLVRQARLDQTVRLGLMVLLGQLVHRAQQDLRVQPGLLVLQVQQAHRVQPGLLVLQVQQVRPVHLVQQEPLVLLGPQALKAPQVPVLKLGLIHFY
jgi:hypothetical protein